MLRSEKEMIDETVIHTPCEVPADLHTTKRIRTQGPPEPKTCGSSAIQTLAQLFSQFSIVRRQREASAADGRPVRWLQPSRLHQPPAHLRLAWRAETQQHRRRVRSGARCAIVVFPLCALCFVLMYLDLSSFTFTFFYSLFFFLFLFLPACFITRGRGLTFTFASAHVDGPGSKPTDAEDHPLYVHPVLLCPRWACYHRMCVIAKSLGSLCLLAHAARYGHFTGASTHQFHSSDL